MLSPSLLKSKNFKWILLSVFLLILNMAVMWLWASFLTLRFQRYLMYLGYLPVDSRYKVANPQIRPPFKATDEISNSDDKDNMVESFYINSADGTPLHVHFYKFPSASRYSTVKNSKFASVPATVFSVPTILFFHGTSGNIGHRVGYAHNLSSVCQCHVMLMNCRGYGLSGGHAHSKGMREDSQAGLEYLLNRSDLVDPKKIFVLGQSMGGAVAVDLAMRNPRHIRGMIIDNTFTSMKDLVPEVLPPFSHLGDYITEDWDSLGGIQRNRGNPAFPHALFLIGEQDELINSNNGKKLFEAAAEAVKTETDSGIEKEVRLLLFKHGYHVHTFRDPFYFDSITQFVNEIISMDI